MKMPNSTAFCAAITVLAASSALTCRGAAGGARVLLNDSIKEVPVGAPESGPHRVREALTAAESAEPLNLVVSLRMRNIDRFKAILESGRTLSPADMEADFLPLKADYDRASAWLASQGFTPTLVDANHTNLFVRGTVAGIANSLGVSFARVSTLDGEFTSAISAPSLPEEIASAVLGIEGLQPHIRMHAPKLRLADATPDFVHPRNAIPSDVLKAYDVPGNLNGAGQTIAIWADTLPLASDLALFDQATGTNENPAGFTVVLVNGGPPPGTATDNEVSLDTQWSSGIAPGANIRIYAAPAGDLYDLETACTEILNEGVVKIVTSSISSPETEFASASLQTASQLFAQMAAAGITIFHGAGDSGSYGGSVAPEYPTTDPYVTALGGTAMTFDSNWNETGETVWPNTGGGYSTFFSRPSWQTGPGVPAGTMRCVPDAAAPSSLVSAYGPEAGLVVVNGAELSVGGDSATGPMWAGLTAIINQARANAGLPTVGLLGPKIYPLIGTSAFTDITVGSDGAYSAGPGYDLCTGVGTPIVANLIQALANQPLFLSQSGSQTVATGSTAVFGVTAVGSSSLAYQWYLNGAAIAGATNSLYVVQATAAAAGAYMCSVRNAYGSVSSNPANLTAIATTDPGRLFNLSTLAVAGSGSQTLTVGFYTGGAGTAGSQTLLVQALGPALNTLGVSGAMPDPQLNIFDSNQDIIGSNAGWGSPLSNQLAVTAADAATYATALSNPASKDSATVVSLAPGGYTVQVSSASGVAGSTLAAFYDDTPSGAYTAASPRLINISCRLQVASNSSLTAGFWVGGSTSKTVLIRADGPALLAQGVTGVMPDPQLTVYNASQSTIAFNAGWGGSSVISSIANSVYAQPFTDPNSKDSAVVLTLPPGGYTAQVSSASKTAGDVLIEVFEVP
jgi:kumamolisin